MADLRRSVLEIFQQGMDAVNSAVNHVTVATRAKMDELTLQNRRKELLVTLAEAIYAQWQQGAQMPEALTETLTELGEVDAQLASIANQKQAEADQKDSASDEQATEAADPQPEQDDDPIVPTLDVKEEGDEENEKWAPAPKINVPLEEDTSEKE